MAVIPRGAGPTGATGAAGAAGPNSIISGTTTTNITGLIRGVGGVAVAAPMFDGVNYQLKDSDGFKTVDFQLSKLFGGSEIEVLNWSTAVAGTLTAFAGVTLSANTLTIGTGAGTVSQTAFAANTFPARASTGDLVAKTITDFGLSLVDDADAAAGRTTLGGTTIGQAVFTQTNPSALTYPRYNADNTVSTLTISDITRSTPYWFNDFINVLASDLFQSPVALNSGTFNNGASLVSAINHPGIISIAASASADSGGYVHANNSLNSHFFGGNQGVVFDAILYFTIVTGTVVRWGYHDCNTSSDAVDGVYFEISGSGAVVLKASSNSVRTSTATITTLSAATWYRFQIMEINATTFEGRVYSEAGSLVASAQVASNVPSTNVRICSPGLVATHTAGSAGQVIVVVDYLGYGFTKALTR